MILHSALSMPSYGISFCVQLFLHHRNSSVKCPPHSVGAHGPTGLWYMCLPVFRLFLVRRKEVVWWDGSSLGTCTYIFSALVWTLLECHAIHARLPSVRLAWGISQRDPRIWSSIFCRGTGYLPSCPDDLFLLKERMAHLILEGEAICLASRLPSCFTGRGTGVWRFL